MKLAKKYILPVLFLSVLAVNANAGVLETPGYVPPPPPPSSSMSTTTDTDEIITGSTDSTQLGDAISDPSEILFYDALMTVLSLF
ncbi:MAG TPA: hypothetical protein VGQ39_10680 [Pyrinomonadaceae bacterium]|jgi:hypothetical protein|nr:hypothetical protein [Pyrinomonadaceae bacterium]